MADSKWRDVTFNIPSLLPLQAPPQEPDAGKLLSYVQSLHNYLADDRQKIARAINVIAYFRTLLGIPEDFANMRATNSKATRTNELTGLMEYDSDVPTGIPAWNPVRCAGIIAPGIANIVSEPVLVNTPPLLNFGDDVVVPSATPTTPSELDQPSEFVWTISGDIVMALVEV